MKLPKIIKDIYRKELIEIFCKTNYWDNEGITKVLQACYKDGQNFKDTARFYRGKHSIHKAIILLKSKRMRQFYN